MSDSKLNLLVQFSGVDKLSGSIKNIAGIGRGGSAALHSLRGEVVAINRALGQSANLRKASADWKQARANTAAARAELARLKGQIVAGQAPTAKLVKSIQSAEKQLVRLGDVEAKAADKTRVLSSELKSAGVDVTRLGDHERKLAADVEAANRKIERQKTSLERTAVIQRRAGAIAAGAGRFGAGASLLVTAPLVAFGAASLRAAREASAASAQVRASLTSMGAVAGRTFPQLQEQATRLMKSSLFDDDEILRSLTANMLTFGKVTGTTFDRAQQAAVDLSTKLGGDLQGAAIMVGKALNDPVKGVTALTRVGVSFTAQQKAMIKTMVKTGNVAGAQALILSELQKQYGGSAAAARKADPAAAAAIDIGEFQQAIGEKLLPKLLPLVEGLSALLDKFNALSPGTQSLIVGLAGLAAVAGPAIGIIAGLATVFGVLATVTAPVWIAIGAVIALGAAAALIYTYWDPIKSFFSGLWTKVQSAFSGPMGTILTVLFPFIGIPLMIYRNWGAISGFFGSVWSYVKSVFTQHLGTFAGLLAPFLYLPMLIYNNWGKISGFFSRVWEGVKSAAKIGLDWFAALPGKFAAFGTNIITGLVNALSPTALTNKLLSIARSGMTAFKNFFGIKSPSRLFMAMGGHMTMGLAQGLDRGGVDPLRSMRRLATGVAGAGAMALAGPALAGSGAPGAGVAARGPAVQSPAPITINIYQREGEDSRALADRIAEVLANARRKAQLSGYGDDF